MEKKLYFAHPVNTYGTELEAELISAIRQRFPNLNIENPGLEKHQEGYQRYREEYGDGMEYFFREVLPECSGVVFLAFRDGKIPAGVAREVSYFMNKGMLVWQITPEAEIRSTFYLKEEDILDVPQTVERIRDKEGNPVPY